MPDDADQLLASQSLHGARSLPALAYADAGLAGRESRAIFGRSWQLVAHTCQLAASGDHVVADLAGLPVIAVRDTDGAIHVLHNVCRHRAGPLARCDGRGARSLRCLYHGWTYALDGRLLSAPEMSGAEGFDMSQIRLPRLRVHVWQGLVFAAGDDAGPFEPLVDGIATRLGADAALESLGHHQRVSYDVACNWKVYVDNYLEGYHLPHVHPELNRLLDYRGYRTELSGLHSLQWSPLESADALYGRGEALYYWLWPNTMLNVLPGRLQTNRVVPLAVDRCRVEFDFYHAGADLADAAARREADVAFSDAVQHEDLRICEDVQRGLASGSYVAGRLNPLREDAVHHFHELYRKALREDPAA